MSLLIFCLGLLDCELQLRVGRTIIKEIDTWGVLVGVLIIKALINEGKGLNNGPGIYGI